MNTTTSNTEKAIAGQNSEFTVEDYNAARISGSWENAAIIAESLGWEYEAARMRDIQARLIDHAGRGDVL